MRKGKFRGLLRAIGSATFIVLASQPLLGLAQTSSAQSAQNREVFFRLLSKYQHGDETIAFDVVVGCGVRVTSYTSGDRSYDSARAPVVYGKATRDGGAIWQLIPHACAGETTENGQVPPDFLPGAIWFDSKDDFSFGIGYFTELAFISPRSKLRFLGASITAAARADWEAFQPELSQNLIDPSPFSVPAPWPSEAEARSNLWNKAKLAEWWRGSFQCHGVQRFTLTSPEARRILSEYRPDAQPQYWRTDSRTIDEVMRRLRGTDNHKGPMLDGRPEKDHFWFERAGGGGFPTEEGGGRLRTAVGAGKISGDVFPFRADEGIPWMTPAVTKAPVIYRDVEVTSEQNGFAYCYSLVFGRGLAGELHVPNWSGRNFETRVNGVPIDQSKNNSEDRVPRIFFEGDQYLYRSFSFGWG
jgi:hypothetical protein